LNTIAKKNKKKTVRVLLGFLVSLLCIWWVLHSVDVGQVIHLLKAVDLSWFFIAVAATFASYFMRSWRWPFFFSKKAPTLFESYQCLNAGFFMNNVLPARIGELVRAHLGGRVTKQSRSVVLATIAAERLADGLCISLFFVGSAYLASNSLEASKIQGVYWVSILFFIASVSTIILLLVRNKVFSYLERLGKIMPGHLSAFTLLRVRRFIEGLEPLLEPFRLIILSIFSLLVWSVEIFVYWCVVKAFGADLGLSEIVLFLTVVNFSSLIPAAPGGIGVIEAVATLVLTKVGVDKEVALSMVATQHLIQYAVVGFPGSYYFFKLGGSLPDSSEDEDFDSLQDVDAVADVSMSMESPIPAEVPAELQGILADIDNEELIDVSVVIPAYNEEQRLPSTLLSVLEYLRENYQSFEIIVVDDGSSDQTPKIVRQFVTLAPQIKLFVLPYNRGKGYAVKFGVLNAIGRRILFNDADGASPIEELSRLEKALDDGAEVAIGSRARYSADTAVETLWYRKLMGRVYNGIVNLVILPGIADTQCGFKLFRREAAMPIFKMQRAEGFSFDVELLFLSRKVGCKIAEVPINWTNVPGSKVSLGKDSLLMFRDIMIFRMRDLLGGYGTASSLQILNKELKDMPENIQNNAGGDDGLAT
jgi:dolichyl-phosphate beta-glucosyltransferase